MVAPDLNQTAPSPSFEATPFFASSSGVMHPKAPNMAHRAWMISISLRGGYYEQVAELLFTASTGRSLGIVEWNEGSTCIERRSLGLLTDQLCPNHSLRRIRHSGMVGGW